MVIPQTDPRRSRAPAPASQTILNRIRLWWGSEDAFDEFVRAELPPLIAANTRRSAEQVGRLAAEHMNLALGG